MHKKISMYFILVFLFVLQKSVSAISVAELRQIFVEQEQVKTAHLKYTKEVHFNFEPAKNEGSIQERIDRTRNHQLYEIDEILDFETKQIKSVQKDVRDLTAIMKDNDIPEEMEFQVSLSKNVLYSQNNRLWFIESDFEPMAPQAVLMTIPEQSEGINDARFKKMFYGVLNKDLLENEDNVRISDGDNKTINVIISPNDQIEVYAELDPALAYRLRKYETYYSGKLQNQIILDNYKNINSVPYPFSYIEKSYDSNGKLSREHKFITKYAEFGIELKKEDFQVYIPKGTLFTDAIMTNTRKTLYKDGNMGVDDFLHLKP